MKVFKLWFLSAILTLGFFTISCSSDSDTISTNEDDQNTPTTTDDNSRKNPNVVLSTTVAPNAFSTKIVIEEYTATWCGYCPQVAHAMEKAAMKNSNVIGIGIHDDTAMGFRHVKNMLKKFEVTGFPSAFLNRSSRWGQSFGELKYSLSQASNIGIALQSTIENKMLTGTIQIGCNADLTKSLNYVIYLVEDKILANQSSNYNKSKNSPFYGKGNPIVNFEHRNVLRKSATDIYGDIIPEHYTKKGKVCEADFKFRLGKYNKDNCYIVAFVVENDGQNILNAQMVKVGSIKAFD